MKVLSFDQSYQRTGVGISNNGKVVKCFSVELNFSSKTLKRKYLQNLAKALVKKHKPDMITVERTRMYSGGFVSQGTIMALGALVAAIVDAVYPVKTYSIDTRSWKAKVIGWASADKKDAVNVLKMIGFSVDHDAADAGCMSLYPYKKNIILKEEK